MNNTGKGTVAITVAALALAAAALHSSGGPPPSAADGGMTHALRRIACAYPDGGLRKSFYWCTDADAGR
jgi:hypothetical protein